MNDSTTRFSNRVADYVKYRPGYPFEIVAWLQQRYHLSQEKIIADIGSGTGISTSLFLKAGNTTLGVEPNKEMRDMSVKLLAGYPHFRAINGRAEATTLDNNSVDVIVCGQAFHWFDMTKAKQEFRRILRKDGILVLIWNERLTDSGFEKEYDKLLIKYGTDYTRVDHRNTGPDAISSFFSPLHFELITFPNKQVFDFDGLRGRLLSSSYVPAVNEMGHESMLKTLRELFDRYNQNDQIAVTYVTKVYAGVF